MFWIKRWIVQFLPKIFIGIKSVCYVPNIKKKEIVRGQGLRQALLKEEGYHM